MSLEAGPALTFRPHNEDDFAFLHSSWAESYYAGSQAKQTLSPEEFHSFHRPIRERFFQKPTATVIVCSPEDDPWLITGWIGVEVIPSAIIIQYLYVKDAFKRRGIATDLIKRAVPSRPVIFTHLTERAARILAKNQQLFHDFRHIPHLV